jgi:hypothetical protein
MEISKFKITEHGSDFPIEMRNFIEKNHYKATARSLMPKKVFGLWHEGLLIGVAVYGLPCGRGVTKTYGDGTLELRRFCIVNEAPKNSESFFLGGTLRALKKSEVSRVVSFADPNKNHEGIIYKATNWKYLGTEKYRQQYLKYRGKEIPMRQVYQKSKKTGEYVPSALKYQALRAKGAKAILTKPKHVFIYDIRR